MLKDSLIIAMDDNPSHARNPKIVSYTEALDLNSQWQYGIFFSINGFKGRRIKENLTSINAWAIDLDSGTKQEMRNRIMQTRIFPSLIIETQRGFHVYWFAGEASIENYKEITEMRLAPYFQADTNAVDICRILRYPGFLHWKDPKNPFLVQEVYRNDKIINEDDMLNFFARKKEEKKVDLNIFKKPVVSFKFTPTYGDSHTFWERINNLNCQNALTSLSGTSYVKGDEFEFRENHNGTTQIWVNGQSSSCWLDKNGMIGSSSGGGPTIANWLYWYHHDWSMVAQILKEHFNIEK